MTNGPYCTGEELYAISALLSYFKWSTELSKIIISLLQNVFVSLGLCQDWNNSAELLVVHDPICLYSIQDSFTAALSASPLSPIDQDKAGGNVSSLRSHLVTRKSAPGMNIRQLNNSSIY